jgi:hypothetical protein
VLSQNKLTTYLSPPPGRIGGVVPCRALWPVTAAAPLVALFPRLLVSKTPNRVVATFGQHTRARRRVGERILQGNHSLGYGPSATTAAATYSSPLLWLPLQLIYFQFFGCIKHQFAMLALFSSILGLVGGWESGCSKATTASDTDPAPRPLPPLPLLLPLPPARYFGCPSS